MTPESPKSFHQEGKQLDIDFEFAEQKRIEEEKKQKLFQLLNDFFKNKPKPGGFNFSEIMRNYAEARIEYFKEKETKSKNPNYHGIGWEKIMANHKPSIFTSSDWLHFVSSNREELTKILEGK